VDAKMADYLEGDLPLSDRALFDGFLDSDPDARQEVAELRRTIALLRSLPSEEPPADLVFRVMERVRAGEAAPAWWIRAGAAIARALRPSILIPAAAGAAAALAGVALWPSAGVPGAAPSPVAAVVSQAAPSSQVAQAADHAPKLAPPPSAPSAGLDPREYSVAAETPRLPSFQSNVPQIEQVMVPTSNGRRRSPEDALRAAAIAGFSGSRAGAPSASRRLPVPPAGSVAGTASRAELLDQRIETLMTDPSRFAADLRSLSFPEIWLEAIAERAVERAIADAALAKLREAPNAQDIAVAFEAQAVRFRAAGASNEVSSSEQQ
jgi:anti-sigma factor RsiW